MIILAIDPGSEKSAWLIYDSEKRNIEFASMLDNQQIADSLENTQPESGFNVLVIECVESFGMPVGKSVFETCYWVGRFMQAYKGNVERVYRSQVKMHLCNSMRAKDSNIRQALIDKFGGSRELATGTKKNQKVLYGISKDLWSALALAIYYAETETTHENTD
jgi:hypothetical protein